MGDTVSKLNVQEERGNAYHALARDDQAGAGVAECAAQAHCTRGEDLIGPGVTLVSLLKICIL